MNRTPVDAIIQPGVKDDEHLALHDMLEHYKPSNPSHTIFAVDRGYDSYNLIENLSEKICDLLFVQKEFTADSLLSSSIDERPDYDEFDIRIKRFLSRNKSKSVLGNPMVYKYIK